MRWAKPKSQTRLKPQTRPILYWARVTLFLALIMARHTKMRGYLVVTQGLVGSERGKAL